MTQCAEVLAFLETGPKTTAEILREVPCIVHSRVAELRKRGHNIVCEVVGTGASGHRYHLLDSLREVADDERLGPDGPATSRSEPQLASGDPNHLVPVLSPAGPGHVTTGTGNQSASSGPAAHDVEDLQLELDLIDRKLAAGIVVDSENARSTRAILKRQKREIEAKLA